MLSLACNVLGVCRFSPKLIEYLSTHYSQEFKNVVVYLLSKPSPMKTLDAVLAMCGSRILSEFDTMQL
jgi:PAB-dependent poly(A)-specific ribonuclease subunit 3